jgi:predicted alpha/beta-hydrolase family hydrolase
MTGKNGKIEDADQPDRMIDVPTELGPARLNLWAPSGAGKRIRRPVGRLVLGHGAGGGIGAPDLVAVRRAAVAIGWQVVLVEQPWRVAGKRVAPAPARLDLGWSAALAALDDEPVAGPLVIGGRSAGARVACRSALALGARAVCCLAFPLHPPGRPEKSRADELAGAGVPVLVVQGSRDAFGTPAEITALGLDGVEVAEVPGDHALSRPEPVAAAVAARLPAWGKE